MTDFVFVKFGKQIPINHIPVDFIAAKFNDLSRDKRSYVGLVIVGFRRFWRFTGWLISNRLGMIFELKLSGVNGFSNMFFNIFNAGILDEAIHNLKSFAEIALSGNKDFDGIAVKIVAIISELFFPKVNGVVDMLTPEFGNSGIFFGFFFKFGKFVKEKGQVGASLCLIMLELFNIVLENVDLTNSFDTLFGEMA